MILKTKFKILSWAMVFLMLFNITILTTVFIKHKNMPPPPNDVQNQFGPPHGMGNPVPNSGHFRNLLITELEMNSGQIEQFDIFRQEFIHQSHICFDSIRIYSEIIDKYLSDDDYNNEIIEINAKKIGYLHTKLKLNFVGYYSNIHSILEDSQHEQFHTIFVDFKKQKQMNKPHQNQQKFKNKHNKFR
jgi:hypothetical protein